MDKADYATGEPLKGKIQLRYPDGKPVRDSKISVTLRAQKVTIVDGELRYAGLFPVKLEQQELKTDSDGNASLTLPAAREPSRYALTLFAQDGAAYKVRVTREVLIARGATPYRLTTAKSFSQPKEAVNFDLQALGAVDRVGACAVEVAMDAPRIADAWRRRVDERGEGRRQAVVPGDSSMHPAHTCCRSRTTTAICSPPPAIGSRAMD